MITKQFNAKDLTLDEDSRTVIACISTDSVDRDNEVVLPMGLQKGQYGGNPVVLYGHDYSSLPVGSTQWIKADNNTVIAKYRISDKTQTARDIWGLLQDGTLRAHSIGFLPMEQSPPTAIEVERRPDWKGCRNVVRKWELLEFSLVAVPCNAEALALAVSKGYSPDTLKLFGEPEKDCWVDEDEESDKRISDIIDTVIAERPIPEPKFCRSWKSIEKELKRIIRSVATEEEIIGMLKGKA